MIVFLASCICKPVMHVCVQLFIDDRGAIPTILSPGHYLPHSGPGLSKFIFYTQVTSHLAHNIPRVLGLEHQAIYTHASAAVLLRSSSLSTALLQATGESQLFWLRLTFHGTKHIRFGDSQPYLDWTETDSDQYFAPTSNMGSCGG